MTATWAPTTAEVAGCIPSRTVDTSNPGVDEYIGDFTPETQPNDEQAQVFIDHAINDVELAVTTIGPTLEPAAKNAAKWRAAADIELAYPDRQADTNVYQQLDARAKYEWDLLLKAANEQNTGPGSQLPVWYMPDPVPWGDRTDI